jgi:ribonucleoside-diphosphate reductase beta chain
MANDVDRKEFVRNDEPEDSDSDEPLVIGDAGRYSILPIFHEDIYDFYRKHSSTHWVPDDIDLSQDAKDFEGFDEHTKKFIKGVIGFFSSSDIVINQSLDTDFTSKINIMEAKFFYRLQEAMEDIHSITYSLFTEAYILDLDERKKLHDSAVTNEYICAIIKWFRGWINSKAGLNYRIVINTIYECILFSGKFCAIFWICRDGKLPGFGQANEYISRDEGLHVEYGAYLYKKWIKKKLNYNIYKTILNEAIELETQFINEILPVNLIGMNAQSMICYIKYCANLLTEKLNYTEVPYPDVHENPFPFMDAINVNSKNNFFEKKPTQYMKGSGKGNDIQIDNVTAAFLSGLVIKSPKMANHTAS